MNDLIANPLIRRVRAYECVRGHGWGLWYEDFPRGDIVLAPIPLNMILRLGRKVYWWLARGCNIKFPDGS